MLRSESLRSLLIRLAPATFPSIPAYAEGDMVGLERTFGARLVKVGYAEVADEAA